MIPIQIQILLILLADESVAELIGSKVYPMRMPQKGTLPAVVYQRITTDATNSLDGDSGLDNVRMQITCWADKYADADELAQVVRSAITSAPTLKAVTAMGPQDIQDPDTRSYGVVMDFYIWSTLATGAVSALATFERVEFQGDGTNTEITLSDAIAADGFYMVSLNGRLAQETVEYTINAARNKIIFNNPLAGGDYQDEGIVIFQSAAGAQFGRVDFEGNDVITEINLPDPIISGGFYLVTLNGRVAKEGTTYTINAGRDKITFSAPLAGGENKDEGIIIYQKG